MKKNLTFTLFLSLVIILLNCLTASGQSASTDTLESKQIYAEGNVWTSPQSHQNGGMQIYGGRFSYGVRRNVEIGSNFSFSNPNDAEYPPEIQPNVKWKFYENEKYGVKAASGVIAYVPIAKRAGTDAFVMTYANVSKQVNRLKSARLTVGGYALVGRDKKFGTRKGWNFVYDQPLTSKVTFSTQWVTGKNRFGYLTPGFSVSLPKKSSLFFGYSIGNYDYDNHGPYVSLGIYSF